MSLFFVLFVFNSFLCLLCEGVLLVEWVGVLCCLLFEYLGMCQVWYLVWQLQVQIYILVLLLLVLLLGVGELNWVSDLVLCEWLVCDGWLVLDELWCFVFWFGVCLWCVGVEYGMVFVFDLQVGDEGLLLVVSDMLQSVVLDWFGLFFVLLFVVVCGVICVVLFFVVDLQLVLLFDGEVQVVEFNQVFFVLFGEWLCEVWCVYFLVNYG